MCSHKADEPTYRVDIEWTLARCKLFVKCLVKDCLMQCLDGEICIDGMMKIGHKRTNILVACITSVVNALENRGAVK